MGEFVRKGGALTHEQHAWLMAGTSLAPIRAYGDIAIPVVFSLHGTDLVRVGR